MPDDATATTTKPWWKRWWAIAVGIFVVLVVIGAAVGGGDDGDDVASDAVASDAVGAETDGGQVGDGDAEEAPTDDAPTDARAADATEGQDPDDGPLQVGESASLDDGGKARLNSVTRDAAPTDELAAPDPGMTITRIEVELCAGEAPLSVNPLNWQGQTAENRTYEALLGGQTLDTITMAPGNCQRGAVDLEVPEGEALAWVLLTGAGFGEVARWSTDGAADVAPLSPATPPTSTPMGEQADFASGGHGVVYGLTPGAPPSNQFVEPPPGTSFTRVDVEACAGEHGEHSANPLNWLVVLEDNRFVTAELGAQSFSTRDLAPGTCERGTIDFAVPDGASVTAVLHGGAGFDQDARWSVG